MMKSILISNELHDKLKKTSLNTGIKIKSITESALLEYIIKMGEVQIGKRI